MKKPLANPSFIIVAATVILFSLFLWAVCGCWKPTFKIEFHYSPGVEPPSAVFEVIDDAED